MKSRSAANSSRSSATSLALTKEALATRKADGMVLGRPKGPAKNLQLDPLADKIDMYLEKKIDKQSIAKLLDLSPNKLRVWLKVRRLVYFE